MVSIRKIVIASVLLSTAISGSIAFGIANFSLSCSELSINSNELKGFCADRNGKNWYSRLILRGVANVNGQLTQKDESDPGLFEETCQQSDISESGILSATCQDIDGNLVQSSLDLNPLISNYNGQLVYD